jgi:2-keto-4-pentenoate hydratase/2-oxohepta-3-ene-1,7-dioic acid hydratase in catechol pathway
MKLVTVEIDRRPQAGILDGGEIALLGASLKEILASGTDVRRLAGKQRVAVKDAKLLAPVPDPGLVLSVGMNYHEHLKEMKTPVPEKPAAFTKSVASIIASGEPIKVPPSNPSMLDWEGEFSVVIGRPCHAVKAAQALDYVAGYTMVNDVSARDWVAPVFKAQASWARSMHGSTICSARCSPPSVPWARAW